MDDAAALQMAKRALRFEWSPSFVDIDGNWDNWGELRSSTFGLKYISADVTITKVEGTETSATLLVQEIPVN